MVPHSMRFKTASALISVGVVLLAVNWYIRPERVLAWTAALAMLVVLTVALRLSRHALNHPTIEAKDARNLEQITTAVVFAAGMIGVPLALTLARSYGFVDDSDIARRTAGVLTAAFIVMIGNVMPKNLPPLSAGYDNARQQEFHRLAGWTWVLCGLTSAIGWLVLPIQYGATATIVPVTIALAVSIVHLVRLARRARTSPKIQNG